MRVEVALPDLGEDAESKVTVSSWLVEQGAHVNEGEDLIELTTDKAAFTLPAPQSGTVAEFCVREDDTVNVGEIICVLDV